MKNNPDLFKFCNQSESCFFLITINIIFFLPEEIVNPFFSRIILEVYIRI